jgi:hypothetical protein
MDYKFEYKDTEERESIISEHSDLSLFEEQNITEGNFLIFVDTDTYNQMLEKQELANRTLTISEYIQNQDETNLTIIEDSILEIEKNKIINGGI